MVLKYVFANRTATFINIPANLLNNEPKNSPDWVILDIWGLDNFKFVEMLFSNEFINLVVCLAVNKNSWVNYFH